MSVQCSVCNRYSDEECDHDSCPRRPLFVGAADREEYLRERQEHRQRALAFSYGFPDRNLIATVIRANRDDCLRAADAVLELFKKRNVICVSQGGGQ